MNVKEYMIKTALEIANNNKYGYSNNWPNNKFGEGAAPYDGDCGAFCSYCLNQALKQIGINTNEYYEPQGGTAIYNEAYLLKYCNRYNYTGTRNEPGDILISSGHTVMVTAIGTDYTKDTITHASNDYDGKSGDSSGKEIRSQTLYDGGWRYIYRLKDEYNKIINDSSSNDNKESNTTEITPIELLQCAIEVIKGNYGNNPERKTKLVAKYGANKANQIQQLINLAFE